MEGSLVNKVLIVEDEAIVALDLEDKVIGLGYQVVGIADNSLDAIAIFKEQKPDIVLMDINIRGEVDGVDTALLIQKERNVPVIFITAYSNPDIIKRTKAVSTYGYILKPFQLKEIQIAIEIALHKHKLDLQIIDYNKLLEKNVKTRTRELETLNSHLHQEIDLRNQVEKELIEAEKKYKNIVENLGSGLILFDTEYLLEEFNPMSQKIIDWTKLKKGLSIDEIFGIPIKFDLVKKLEEGILDWEKEYCIRKGEDAFYLKITFSKNGNEGVILSILDLTEQRNNEFLLKTEKAKRRESFIEGAEIERKRLADEIHDSLGQKLTAVRLMSAGFKKMLREDSSEREIELVDDIRNLIEEATVEARRISHNLMPQSLNEHGLVAVLNKLAEEVKKINSFEVITAIEENYTRLPLIEELTLYRIAQEAVNNLIKHADASQLELIFKQENNNYFLSIRDNGNGFDWEVENKIGEGKGIKSIQERTEIIGATLQVESTKKGTLIVVSNQKEL